MANRKSEGHLDGGLLPDRAATPRLPAALHVASEIEMANRRSEGRDAERDGAEERTQSSDKEGARCFPIPLLDRKTLLDYLPSLAMATLLGVTAINVLTSNQSLSGDTSKHKGLRQFLLAMPYTLFLFALAGLAAAFAIKRKTRVLGCATGTLLAQLLCLVVMGGIVTQVRGEVDAWVVWPVTGGIIVVVLVVWSVLCAYPKCLRCLSLCCHAKEKEKSGGDIRNSEKKCENCGGTTVNGKSPIPAGEGAERCESCGGARGDAAHRTPGIL